jgi:archaemetzincin
LCFIKKINHLLIFSVSIVFFISCEEINENSSVNKPMIIDMQPFGDFSDSQIEFVYRELLKIYPSVKINKSIELPKNAYYKERNRYRADTLIRYLSRITPKDHITIGFTNKDISQTKGTINDYGIMGLGYKPGKSCVVSTFRLSKEHQSIQLFKLSIHELGHTQGLPHCSEKTCFMRDAKGKNHTDEEKDFCQKCKTVLISKGWRFNH